MDFSAMGDSLGIAFGAELPRIVGAILILIVGWIAAVLVRGGVRRLLAAVQLNVRIAGTPSTSSIWKRGFPPEHSG